MSIKKYKFISPGVFIKEIDNSQLPKAPGGIGPLVIGRTAHGPAMVPIRVNSLSEFVEVFGNPAAGNDIEDVYRAPTISTMAPTYASYAAMAWLTNATPINVIRLLGKEHTSATAAGKAGWMTKDSAGAETTVGTSLTAGGAYGLFLINSSSTGGITGSADLTPQTGALAAVFYINSGGIRLRGVPRGGTAAINFTASSGILMKTTNTYHELTAEIIASDGTTVNERVTFNFNRTSPQFIRNVFNTDPTLTNTSITSTDQQKNYWLGETFERFVLDGDGGYIDRPNFGGARYTGLGSSSAGASFGVLQGLADGASAGTNNQSNHRFASKAAQTGWTISQDLGDRSVFTSSNMPKLFKFHALESGQWVNHNLKVGIENIAIAKNNVDPYGTFDVVIRQLQDTDSAPQILERFSNCNLNPNSTSYIGRKIGDRYTQFSTTDRRNIEYGKYDNRSNHLRIEINQDLEAGSIANKTKLLPFGFWGPPKFADFSVVGRGLRPKQVGQSLNGAGAEGTTAFSGAFVVGNDLMTFPASSSADGSVTEFMVLGCTGSNQGAGARADVVFTGSFLFPTLPLRLSSSDDSLSNPKNAFFGISTNRSLASRIYEDSTVDITRPLPDGLNTSTFNTDFSSVAAVQNSFIFTMDNLVSASNGTDCFYSGSSRLQNKSISAEGHSGKTNYEAVLEYGYDAFMMPVFGGFDGFDITERDPFRNTGMASTTEKTSYAHNSVKEAIDIVSDAEQTEFNIVTIPGVYNKDLTQHLIDTCEDRGDALALIDLEGDFKPADENNLSYKERVDNATVGGTVSNLRDRNLNSSYGAAYFPWVQIYDDISQRLLFTPPSVVALGTMASSERSSALWFAPAGFNRGGLSDGHSGLKVVGITQKLTSKQRDDLYDTNINPIASFPSEGIVVFGQKTLQVTPSALDRINVRRLMIFLKKRISQIASGILFDQNVEATWNRFTGQVGPFLEGVKNGLGLTDYKVVLDNTTTTPDLVDRNILYAKIFLKPARSIEYIAIDFNISRSGAAFED